MTTGPNESVATDGTGAFSDRGSTSLPFEGIRVIELAQWVFVPLCGAVLADLGASVTKIENPAGGDPYRGLVSQGIGRVDGGINHSVELANRGKRSFAADVRTEGGRRLIDRLIEDADVFLTNFRPGALERLGFGVEHVQDVNPSIVYARGHGFGIRGPDRDAAGYDATAYWARGGMAHVMSPGELSFPVGQRGAFGDRAGAMNMAFGIASALLKRERTGEGSVVDVSLLATALWQLSSDVLAALQGGEPRARTNRSEMANPLVNAFRTSDGRHIQLVFLQPDRYWAPFCELVGRPDLAADPRFVDIASRESNRVACLETLDAIFAERTYSEWRDLLGKLDAPWSPVQAVEELIDDVQVVENGYIGVVEDSKVSYRAPHGPVQFDECTPRLGRAPEVGQHTEEIMLELGMDWDDIAQCKAERVIL